MPLKLARREGSALWWITGTIAGRRHRESTGTADRSLAEEIRAAREVAINRAAIYGVRPSITWSQAVAAYAKDAPPGPGTAKLLYRLTLHLGPMMVRDIDQEVVSRAVDTLCRPGAAPATRLRNVITPVQAVLNHAAQDGYCDRPNFKKPRGASGVKRTRWLTPDEWGRLNMAASRHLQPLLAFLVGTGCRLSEALELEWPEVNLTHARAVVWQKQGNERHVELPPVTVAALAELARREGRVFLTDDGRPYRDTGRTSGGQIATAFGGACRRAGLRAVTPHVLRHTWASWSYACEPNPYLLQERGGWASDQVRRYVKLVPVSMVPEIRTAWGYPGAAQPQVREALRIVA